MLIYIYRLRGLFFGRRVNVKREEKNALSKQRILTAAMQEFALKGFDNASLNTVCSENGISKGIIYHYFKDKDELYLLCMKECFSALCEYLSEVRTMLSGSVKECLDQYFDARLNFFVNNTLYWGLFCDASLNPPTHLLSEIKKVRAIFDALNISILTQLLEGSILKPELDLTDVIDDFKDAMDYFNAQFKFVLAESASTEEAIVKHEKRCHRQLSALLFGVMNDHEEK